MSGAFFSKLYLKAKNHARQHIRQYMMGLLRNHFLSLAEGFASVAQLARAECGERTPSAILSLPPPNTSPLTPHDPLQPGREKHILACRGLAGRRALAGYKPRIFSTDASRVYAPLPTYPSKIPRYPLTPIHSLDPNQTSLNPRER